MLQLPPGFHASVYVRGLTHPTALAYGPDRALYVAEDTGSVLRVPAGATRPRPFAAGFSTPLGLAWRGRDLYVSVTGGLQRVTLRGGAAASRTTVLSRLPYGLHQQDGIVVRSNGRLYLGSGSTCNRCTERDRRSAAILSLRPNGSDLRVEATGLRNPYGLALQPGTGRLYASVNGQDELGAGEPAEMVVQIRRGARYGWPACWPSYRRRVLVGACAAVARPVAYLEPHSSADGIAFYTGSSFPRGFRGNLFVAEWGEYLSHRDGRRLVRIVLRPNGTAVAVKPFATGFEHPLALAVDPRGALLVSDWGRGVVYRIQADGHR